MENKIAQVGFGTWKLKKNDETASIIKNAIESGYKLIDTAYSYGNEEYIGQALKDYGQKRDQLFITGKLWNTDRDNVVEACKKTIDNLKCNYLDLYLVHWPASKAVHDDWVEIDNNIWRQMEEVYKLGLAKDIGVSNFKISQLEELLKKANVKPLVNQIEFHPGYMQKELVDYCKKNDIIVQAWSPLGSGKMLKKEELINISKKYNKSVAQICLRWCIQNEVYPVVRSENIDRMKQNLEIFDFTINEEDMNYLNSLDNLGFSGLDSETLTIFG